MSGEATTGTARRRRRGLLPIVLGALAAALLGAAPAAGEVRIVAEERIEPRVIELTIATPAFAEPTKVHVNLPARYEKRPQRRWPVTYVLAGTMNTYRSFNDVVDGVELTKDYPAITVSPNGDSGYWSDWFNGGAQGPPMYETYVIEQLIPLIDERFRTRPERSSRTVLGISMGGYGALMMAARHPDLFAGAASISGAVDSNLQPNGAVLSISPTFQGAEPDAIYGPRATQEVRWRGHNPWDLANNLRDLDVQVRSANGTLNPAIGEDPLSADSVSCLVEAGVYLASVSLHERLEALRVPHDWHDYGAGCHSTPNFKRQIADTLAQFRKVHADPPAEPPRFAYSSIEPAFGVWDWRVRADRRRPLEFMALRGASTAGLSITGSGTTTVTTPAFFRGVRRVDLAGAEEDRTRPGRKGRIRFTVDLGPPSTGQQYRLGSTTRRVTRKVELRPHARIRITAIRAREDSVRVCARALGGGVRARVRLLDGGGALAGARKLALGERRSCRTLRLARPAATRRVTLRITGRDGFGHRASARRGVSLPPAAVAR